MQPAARAAGGQLTDAGAAQLDVTVNIGQARLGGYPHGRVLIGAGGAGMAGVGAWPCGAPACGGAPEEEGGHGEFEEEEGGMSSISVESSEVPFLALEMNSVLLYLLYSLPAAEVEEHGAVVVRLVYLALFVQICMDYHAHLFAGREGSSVAAIGMDQETASDASQNAVDNLEALILSEMRQLELPAALARSRLASNGAVAVAVEGGAVAGSMGRGVGSLESYVFRCSLPFLRRARFLMCVHSGDMSLAPAATSISCSTTASLEAEWRAAMEALRLPVAPSGVVPAVGEYSQQLVRGWLRELEPAKRDASCWPLVYAHIHECIYMYACFYIVCKYTRTRMHIFSVCTCRFVSLHMFACMYLLGCKS